MQSYHATRPELAIDQQWMRQAISLAAQGLYGVKPNPAVGCVLVKDGICIGQGFHAKAGCGHAEVVALQDAANKGNAVEGATAYVTLEPCAHYGKTPPCALTLVNAKVGSVVMASLDANPLVAGRGLAILEQAGIPCTVGVCSEAAKALNTGFLYAMEHKMPYVRAKIASSLDGRTAMASGESKWITSAQSRLDVQRMRAVSGAVITGIGTVLADNPLLSVRSAEAFGAIDIATVVQPYKVLIDRQAQLTADYHLWHDPQLIWVTQVTPAHKPAVGLHWQYEGLTSLLAQLTVRLQVADVMIEAGATLTGAFVEAGLVAELVVYMAPCVLGATARPMLALAIDSLADKKNFSLVSTTTVGDDIKLVLTAAAI